MRTGRAGFTLVEMMVAMTLTIFVMVILSQCFVQGLETFSGLKAIGDMQEELRTASTLLRADLSLDHFEGKRRLSDPVSVFTGENRIREGFFVIGSGYPYMPSTRTSTNPSRTKVDEGQEDSINSYRFTDHFLHFSAKMRGNARERFFAAPCLPAVGTAINTYFQKFQPPDPAGSSVPGRDAVFQDNTNVVSSPWAEIVYVMLPTGTTIDPRTPAIPGGRDPSTKLCALYRCQYVVLPFTTDAKALNLPTNTVDPRYAPFYPGFGGIAGNAAGNVITFYSPNDLAGGPAGRTFNPYQYFSRSAGGNDNTLNNKFPPRAAALVLSNVISFQVLAMTSASNGDFVELTETASAAGQSQQRYFIPFDTANYSGRPTLPTPPGTSAPTLNPTAPTYSILGLQIVIRIWDPKSRQARQVTLMQDL